MLQLLVLVTAAAPQILNAVEPGSIDSSTLPTISLHGDDVSLQLILHPSPLAKNATYTAQQNDNDNDNDLTQHPGVSWSPPVILTGKATGDPDSWAKLIQLPNGLYLGQVYAFGNMYAVEPDSTSDTNRVAAQPSLVEQNQALLQRIQRASRRSNSATATADYLLYPPSSEPEQTTRNATNDLRALTGVNVPRVIRIGIVVDSRFNDHHNGQGLNRALSLINVIDGIYQQQLGVAIQLESVIDYTNPQIDPMRNLQGSVENILEAFGSVRLLEQELPANLTMVHLFTGLRDPNGVLGLGWIGTACRTDGFDVSLSTPFEFDALLAAHEMAHNLGAGHDNTAACAANSSRLMWPRLSSRTQPEFSDCSLLAIAPGIAASCNIDNIDLELTQQIQPSANAGERIVRLSASNLDPTRIAPSVRTRIDLPTGSSIIEIPANCGTADESDSAAEQADSSLFCLYGDIEPRRTAFIDLRLQVLPSPAQQILQSQLFSLSTADTQPLNNLAQLNLNGNINVASAPTNTLNDANASLLSAAATDNQGLVSAGGSGGVSKVFIAVLFSLLLQSACRRFAKWQMYSGNIRRVVQPHNLPVHPVHPCKDYPATSTLPRGRTHSPAVLFA